MNRHGRHPTQRGNRHGNQRGVVIIALIVVIAIMGVLGSAIYALRTTATHGVIQASHQNRAWVLAESGLRYALTDDFSPNAEYTVISGTDGLLRRYPAATAPAIIDPAGFRITRTSCGIASTGVVWENSPFEASQTVTYEYSGGMPAWTFNAAPSGGVFEDTTGMDQLRTVGAEGTAWSWSACAGGARGALVFSGGYAVTDFLPHCELGTLHPFTIVALVRPDNDANSSLLGVKQGTSRFSLGITGKQWSWEYGNDSQVTTISVSTGTWQRLIWTFTGTTVTLRVDGCGILPHEESSAYNKNGTLPSSPTTDNRLYVGAENNNGKAGSFFSGAVDSLAILDQAVVPTNLPLACKGNDAVAYFPLNNDVTNQGTAGGPNAVLTGGPTFGTDRFACLQSALSLDGKDDALDAAPATPPLVAGYPFSLAAWVRVPTSLPFGDRMALGLVHATSSDDRFGIVLDGDASGRVCLHTQSGIGNMNRECATTAVSGIADGRWHHLAAVWRDQDHRELYLDGQPVSLISTDSVPDNVVIDSLPDRLSLGRWGDAAGGAYFPGDMDDVAVYDRGLSAEEIQNIFREGTP